MTTWQETSLNDLLDFVRDASDAQADNAREEIVRRLAAEKEAHGQTFERLVNVGNVAEQMREALILTLGYIAGEVEGGAAHSAASTVLAAYDEFRTAAKPEAE